MYFIIYETTNLVNGKIYVGSHQTKNLNDGYLGSGKYFQYSLKKYGEQNFVRKILYEYDTAQKMYAKENEIVNDSFISRKDTYNIKLGGNGGFDHLNYGKLKIKNGRFNSTYQKNLSPFSNPEKYGKDLVETWREKGQQKLKELIASGKYEPGTWAKNHPKELENIRKIAIKNALSANSRQKRKDTFKKINHQQGSKNSNYGNCWITNGIDNKLIKKEEIIPDGWYKGRKINRGR